MTEQEKKVIYYIESMRDGCTADILHNYFQKEELDSIIKKFIKNDYILLVGDMLVINYDKLQVDTWENVIIK